MAIAIETLLAEAACYGCLGVSLPDMLKLALLNRIASGGTGGGSGTPGGSDTQVQFNDAGAFAGVAGLVFDDATNNLAVGASVTVPLIGSPAATSLSFASNGTTRANFTTDGHLVFNTDNTNDIGASGATRPRSVFAGTSVVVGPTVTISGGTGNISCTSIGTLGAISAGTTLVAGTTIESGTTVRTARFTVATLPAPGGAATRGRRACVTDANAPVFGSTVAGGGAAVVPVFDNGVNWIVG